MATISFAQSIQSHVEAPAREVSGATVREALDEVLRENKRLRGYILDDAGAVRKHVTVIVNGKAVQDRVALTDPVGGGDEIFVMQALSGG